MQLYTKYLKNIYLQGSCFFQLLRVAIVLKHKVDLLSLIFSGKDFQKKALSHIKVFLVLFTLEALANVSNFNYHEDYGLKFLF